MIHIAKAPNIFIFSATLNHLQFLFPGLIAAACGELDAVLTPVSIQQDNNQHVVLGNETRVDPINGFCNGTNKTSQKSVRHNDDLYLHQISKSSRRKLNGNPYFDSE